MLGGILKSDPSSDPSYSEVGTKGNGYPDEVKTEEVLIVPDGYRFLPRELFRIAGVPPPLVSVSWLDSFNSSEDSTEDSIPLAKLKKIIKKCKKEKKISCSKSLIEAEDGNTLSEKVKKERDGAGEKVKNYVNRKRGRPKKQVFQVEASEVQFENGGGDLFWSSEGDDSSNLDAAVPRQDHLDTTKEEGSAHSTNENEHDYYKPFEKEEKRKKIRAVVQGVKTEDSKVIFPCMECGKSFSAASTLKSHQRIHNGTLLTCSECHKGFVSKYLLKCHMRIHNGDLFMCHKCGKGFITAELLKIHTRAHTGHRPFVCTFCGKSFPTSSNMVQHKQTHNMEKKFLCSQCGSSFAQKRCLDYHMIAHSEKKNICNVCGKLWARKNDLIEHMRVHTGVKPYSCSNCPQKFSQASSLKRHHIVHMDVDVDERISCEICHKTFKCQVYYKRHLKKHIKSENLYNGGQST